MKVQVGRYYGQYCRSLDQENLENIWTRLLDVSNIMASGY